MAVIDKKVEQTLSHVLAALCAASVLFLFACKHEKKVRKVLFGKTNTIASFVKGIGYAAVAYPFIFFLVQIVHLLVNAFIPIQKEQLALLELRYLQDTPWLFWLLGICIVTVIPFVEELLFRGFIQNFLMRALGTKWSIITTSILFASFHYAPAQGATNVLILTGLFSFSLLVGIMCLKKSSLATAVGMHAGFNGATLLLVYNTAIV